MSKISHHHKFERNCKKTVRFGDHQKYLSRITKTLYYGKLPNTDSLSIPVTELAAELFSEAQKGESLNRLHYDEAARISRNACVSPCSLVLTMLYLERLKNCNPEYLKKTAPSDLFLVSLMVSSKFLFDDGESDEVFIDEWAASGGISVNDLVHLEKNFLKAIDWEIYVNELTFWKKLNELERTLAKKQGSNRGFFTYTELECLTNTIDLHNFLHCLTAVTVILAATYTAGFLTIIGSMFLASQIPGTSLHNQPVIEDKQQRGLDAVDVFKTGIFLASITTGGDKFNRTVDNKEEVSWDWWNVPTMVWLTKTSQFLQETVIRSCEAFWPINAVMIEMDGFDTNCIDKATKTRIQDQMETSWHKEWTDMIKYGLFYNPISHLKS